VIQKNAVPISKTQYAYLTITRAHLDSIDFTGPVLKYFEVSKRKKSIKVRIIGREALKQARMDKVSSLVGCFVDLVIVPYLWEVGETRGWIYYLVSIERSEG